MSAFPYCGRTPRLVFLSRSTPTCSPFCLLTIFPAKPYNPKVFSFIETKLFTKLVQEYLTDEEYQELQKLLMDEPEAGTVVPASGGVRKLRFGGGGRGKRGGFRVIYFTKVEQGEFWMLTMYPKNVKDDIPARALRQIRKEVENG